MTATMGAQTMPYQPPPGRPISRPPCEQETSLLPDKPKRTRRSRLTPEEREAIAADLRAGATMKTIQEKYGYRGKQGAAYFLGAKPEQSAAAPCAAKPERMPGEHHLHYANRVSVWLRENDPEWARRSSESMSKGSRAAYRKHKRAAAKLITELNATETRGVWAVSADIPDWERRTRQIEKRFVVGRTWIYLMPYPKEPAPAPEMPAAAPAAAPSFFRRWFSWLLP